MHPPPSLNTQVAAANGEVIITNDGATILNKMTVAHPAAKMLVELAKSQVCVCVCCSGGWWWWWGASGDMLCRIGRSPTNTSSSWPGALAVTKPPGVCTEAERVSYLVQAGTLLAMPPSWLRPATHHVFAGPSIAFTTYVYFMHHHPRYDMCTHVCRMLLLVTAPPLWWSSVVRCSRRRRSCWRRASTPQSSATASTGQPTKHARWVGAGCVVVLLVLLVVLVVVVVYTTQRLPHRTCRSLPCHQHTASSFCFEALPLCCRVMVCHAVLCCVVLCLMLFDHPQ